MQTPLFLRMFGPNVLHQQWGPLIHRGHSMPISMRYFTVRTPIYLFLYLHSKKYRMRPTSKWEASLHEDLKNQLHTKRRLHLLKNWTVQGQPDLENRICFISVVKISTKHSCSSLLLAFTMTPFCKCACYCTKDSRYYACQTTLS